MKSSEIYDLKNKTMESEQESHVSRQHNIHNVNT